MDKFKELEIEYPYIEKQKIILDEIFYYENKIKILKEDNENFDKFIKTKLYYYN